MPSIVSVRWLDAHTLGMEEIAAEDAVEMAHKPCPTTTYGYLVKSDPGGVTVATDVQEWEGKIIYRCLHHIPRAMIVTETSVEIGKKRRRS